MFPRRSLRVLIVLLFSATCTFAQIDLTVNEIGNNESASTKRNRGLEVLSSIKDTLKEFYYDPTYHGIDIEQRFKDAAAKIKTLDSNSQIFRVIAGVLLELNDSHTVFIPPARTNRVVYGFTMKMVGGDCMITDVKKGSDAESKGLRPGDVIDSIGQYPVTRDNFWLLRYYLYALDPQMNLRINLRDEDGKKRELIVKSGVKTLEDREKEAKERRKDKKKDDAEDKRYKCATIRGDLTACRLDTFEVEDDVIDKIMTEASKNRKLILDLRGNGGGRLSTDEHLMGYFTDHELKVASLVERKKSQDMVAKPVKNRLYSGDLVVLIDSDSASASEIFARFIQIIKRGSVVGDVSAGAVMTSYMIPLTNMHGYATFSAYGMNVTIADVIMSDGGRLENVGVIPDKAVGPTPEALRDGNDPVLSYAASLLGDSLTPADAGALHFIVKKPEDPPPSDDKADKKP